MTSYVESIEKENEELRYRLANIERIAEHMKSRVAINYLVNYEDLEHTLSCVFVNLTHVHEFLLSKNVKKHEFKDIRIIKQKGNKSIWCLKIEKSMYASFGVILRFNTFLMTEEPYYDIKLDSYEEALKHIKRYVKRKMRKEYNNYISDE